MINPNDFGKTISQLRIQAGFTQKTLAEALNVTDKAVSKWERGLSCPDISLLPKLSALLDADIEALLSGVSTIDSYSWKGVLILEDNSIPLDTLVYDKPMVYYLISYFLLLGITQLLVICSEKNKIILEKITACNSKYGINLVFCEKQNKAVCQCFFENRKFLESSNVFICYDNIFLFGASLTRSFQGYMSSKDKIIQLYQQNNIKLPFMFVFHDIWKCFFSKNENIKIDTLEKVFEKDIVRKQMGRGIISIPFDSYENINDISTFVRIYQTHQKQSIADLHEIAVRRGLLNN